MAAIGSLIFCTDCGNLLPASKGSEKNILHCECCGAENRGVYQCRRSETSDEDRILARSDTEKIQIDTASKTIVTRTKPSDFPSLLRQKLSTTQTVERHKIQTSQVDPNMDCPECGTIGIRYTEVQMRSADEGSTIIYNCECGHKYGFPCDDPLLLAVRLLITSLGGV